MRINDVLTKIKEVLPNPEDWENESYSEEDKELQKELQSKKDIARDYLKRIFFANFGNNNAVKIAISCIKEDLQRVKKGGKGLYYKNYSTYPLYGENIKKEAEKEYEKFIYWIDFDKKFNHR